MAHLAFALQHYRKFGKTRRFLYLFSLVAFFWTLFNGTVSYLFPNLITNAGLSHIQLGIIMASSSAWGAIFDFLISKYGRHASYRWFFLLLIAVSFLFPFLLWRNQHLWLFFMAAAVWGFFYDLSNFGVLSFISRETPREEYAESFGVVSVFKSLGYLVAPLVIGWKFSEFLDRGTLSLLWTFLLFSLIFLIILFWQKRQSANHSPGNSEVPQRSFIRETIAWLKVGRILWPVLTLVIFLNIWDAFFWTLGPLVGSQLAEIKLDGGLFMAAYTLPSLLAGWFVGPVVNKIGKKRTAFAGLLLGSIAIIGLLISVPAVIQLAVVFLSSLLMALAWPSINGAFADYIRETPSCEKEIEGLQDFASNWGYIIGPLLAGFLSTWIAETKSFALLGVAGVLLAVFLLKKTPRQIVVRKIS